MHEQMSNVGTRLEMAEALVKAIKAGNELEADVLIQDLSNFKKSQLFVEVGRLTRELHEAINGFLLDAKISNMTNIEIPDAKERLNHVITMTQESADRTLTAVEKSIPLVEDLENNSKDLLHEWEKLRARLLDKNDFKELSDTLILFLKQSQKDTETLHKNLSEVLMAQDFQDLTGQIIKKVITLVHDVEKKLVKLVSITGGKMEHSKDKSDDPSVLEGPRVPGLNQGNQVNNQDDVDDLLSSLGF